MGSGLFASKKFKYEETPVDDGKDTKNIFTVRLKRSHPGEKIGINMQRDARGFISIKKFNQGPHGPMLAEASGKIKVGDGIIQVNGRSVPRLRESDGEEVAKKRITFIQQAFRASEEHLNIVLYRTGGNRGQPTKSSLVEGVLLYNKSKEHRKKLLQRYRNKTISYLPGI